MPYDLVLRGGHVIDPANGRDSVMDVALSGDRIARVAPRIDDPAVKVLNAEGLYVTPGLIDIHVHVFPFRGPDGPTWQSSIVPDAHSFRAGVTTLSTRAPPAPMTSPDSNKTGLTGPRRVSWPG